MAADIPPPETPEPIGAVIPIDHAPSIRTPTPTPTTEQLRHDNPHWPVQSPTAAADALHLHGDCPWHCSTRIAAIVVSRNDYQYFRDRRGKKSWTPSRSDC